MRKLFAFLAAVAAILLTACTIQRLESAPSAVTTDGNGVYYTPLDIDLLYMGDAVYELQIGLYRDAMIGARHEDFVALGNEIGKAVGKKLEFVDFRSLYDSNEKSVIYFSYSLQGVTNLKLKKREFGFFNYRYDYEMISDNFVNEIFGVVVSSVKSATEKFGSYTVDDAATYASFGICIDADLSAQNAKWMTKRSAILDYEFVDCLVFDKGANDLTSLDVSVKVKMAAGWFIVPIILGLITVAIIYAVKFGHKNEQIFREDGSEGALQRSETEDKDAK